MGWDGSRLIGDLSSPVAPWDPVRPRGEQEVRAYLALTCPPVRLGRDGHLGIGSSNSCSKIQQDKIQIHCWLCKNKPHIYKIFKVFITLQKYCPKLVSWCKGPQIFKQSWAIFQVYFRVIFPPIPTDFLLYKAVTVFQSRSWKYRSQYFSLVFYRNFWIVEIRILHIH